MREPYTFPSGYDTAPCFLVPISAMLIPFVAGALAQFEERRLWATDDDHERGYNAMAELGACMTALCAAELIESNNRLYRLLDNAFNGTIYDVAGTDPITGELLIDPPIPSVPTPIYSLPGATRRLERIDALLDNLANGTISFDASDPRNFRQQLADILNALLSEENLDAEQLAELAKIVALLGV